MKQTLLIITCFLTLNLMAQKRNTQFSIGAESAVMATGQAYKAYKLGFGGSGKVLFPTGKKDFFTLTVGVLSFPGRDGDASEVFSGVGIPSGVANIATPSLTIIPVKGGYKHFFTSKFNTELEAGYTNATVLKVTNTYTGNVGGYTFAGGFGFLVAKKIDIGLRYELFESTASETNYTSFIGLRTLVTLDFK